MSEQTALLVGKWSLGFSKSRDLTFVRLEFTDREPINLAIPNAEADALAAALTEQAKLRGTALRQH